MVVARSLRAGKKKRKPLGLAPPTHVGTVLAFVKRVSALNVKEKYERSQRRIHLFGAPFSRPNRVMMSPRAL
jgi:hypothetical protein